MRTLPNWLDEYINYTSYTEAPDIFNKWVGLSTISMVLQRKVWVRIAGQKWHPNLYVLLVGDAGARKGTAMNFARPLITKDLNVHLASDKGSTIDLIETCASSTETFTIEGKQFVHSSISIFSPEFVVFMKKEPDGTIYDFLNDAFDCRDGKFEYGTISRGKKKVDNPYLSMLGATTPDLLTDTLPKIAIGGGFTSRFIMVSGKRFRKIADAKLKEELRPSLIADLKQIHELQGPFLVEESYYNKYKAWYESSPDPKHLKNRFFLNYLERRATHLGKLSMCLSAAEGNSLTLKENHFTKALELLEEVESLMPNIFEGYGESKTQSVNKGIISFIKQHGSVEKKTLIKEFIGDLESMSQLDELLTLSIQAGWIKETSSGIGTKITFINKGQSNGNTKKSKGVQTVQIDK